MPLFALSLLPGPHVQLAAARGTPQPLIMGFGAAASSVTSGGFDLRKLRAEAAAASQIIEAVEANTERLTKEEPGEITFAVPPPLPRRSPPRARARSPPRRFQSHAG